MSTAERTRAALRRHPFLALALRAGVLNYRATARYLDCGDDDAVAAALRREHEGTSCLEASELDVRVRLERNVDPDDLGTDRLPVPSDDVDEPVSTVTVAGELPPAFVATALLGFALEGTALIGHAATTTRAVFVVANADAAGALRTVEDVAAAVPRVDPP